MTGINKIGSEASALLTAIAQAKKDVKHTREANKRRIGQLRPLLQQVWDAFDRGETVNGQSTKKQWCEEFAFTTQRNVQYILAGGNKNRPSAKRFSMKNDAIITIHGKEFRIVNAPESVDDLQRIKGAGAVRYRLNMVVTPVEEKTEAAVPATATAQPVTHIRVSPRKALCQTRFINRKIKGAVYSDTPTCPDCIAVRDKTLGEGTLQEARKKALAKKPTRKFVNEDGSEDTSIIAVKLTSAQYREAGEIAKELGIGWSPKVTLVFQADEYQSQAKELVIALEAKIADLNEAYRKWTGSQNVTYLGKLLDWTNKSPEALAAKKVRSTKQSAIKAIEGAIKAVVMGDGDPYGDGDPTRNIDDWYEGEHYEEVERQAEETYQKRIAELDAKRDAQQQQVTVVVNDSSTEPEYDKEAYAKAENWSQKVCIKGSPENVEWSAQCLRNRELEREIALCEEDEENEEGEEESEEEGL